MSSDESRPPGEHDQSPADGEFGDSGRQGRGGTGSHALPPVPPLPPVAGEPTRAWILPTDDDQDEGFDVPRAGRHAAVSPPPIADPASTSPMSLPRPAETPRQSSEASYGAPDPVPYVPLAGRDDDQPTGLIPVVPADAQAFGIRRALGEHPESGWAHEQTATGFGPAEAAAPGGVPGAVLSPPDHGRSGDSGSAGDAPKRDIVRTVARGLGQTLITLGVVVLLFVVYEVYITDIFSHQKQVAATKELDEKWSSEHTQADPAATSGSSTTETSVVTVTDPNVLVADPATRKRTYPTTTGEGFAKIYVPALGADYVYTIIEGTNSDDLNIGPGHYPDTQYPGEQGNFAVAGHRVSKGSPFNQLGVLNSCDAIVIETQDDWFVYRVLPMDGESSDWKPADHANCDGVAPLTGQYAGIYGREITNPSDYAQVLPVPHINSSAIPADAQRLLTLTTCHPQFSDAQRMIVHGVLVKNYEKADGFTPPELNEG